MKTRKLRIALLFTLVASLAVFAMPSNDPPRIVSVERMPPPAANATEGNVQDLSQ